MLPLVVALPNNGSDHIKYLGEKNLIRSCNELIRVWIDFGTYFGVAEQVHRCIDRYIFFKFGTVIRNNVGLMPVRVLCQNVVIMDCFYLSLTSITHST